MAKFQKGQARPEGAGRAKGTPNKRTEALLDKCDRMGVDPFEALLEFAKSRDEGLAMSALKEICQYIYPKRKAIEMTADINMELAKKAEEIAKLTKDQQIKLLESNLARLKGSK